MLGFLRNMRLLINPYLFTGVASLFLIGTFDLPYFYYEILKIVACASFSWLAFLNFMYEGERMYELFFIVSLVLAFLFNPFVPFYLQKELWIPIDIFSALFVFADGLIISRRISSEL